MSCPNCGTPTQPGQNFCARCGMALSSLKTAPTPQHLNTSYQQPVVDSRATITKTVRRGPLFAALGSLVLLGLLFTLGLLAWLRAGAPSTPAPANPTQVLNRARDAFSSVESVKYDAEAGFFGLNTPGSGITSTRPLTVAIQGEIELPSSYTLSSNAPQLGSYTVIGDRAWHRRSGSSNWVEQETSSMSLGLINPLTFFNYLEYYQEGTPVEIGAEKRGDVTVRRIRFQVDTNRMGIETSEPALRSILAISQLNVEAWIEDTTFRIERMTLFVESEDGTSIVLRNNLSDYNGAVDIKPPTQ